MRLKAPPMLAGLHYRSAPSLAEGSGTAAFVVGAAKSLNVTSVRNDTEPPRRAPRHAADHGLAPWRRGAGPVRRASACRCEIAWCIVAGSPRPWSPYSGARPSGWRAVSDGASGRASHGAHDRPGRLAAGRVAVGASAPHRSRLRGVRRLLRRDVPRSDRPASGRWRHLRALLPGRLPSRTIRPYRSRVSSKMTRRGPR